jgi:hypothetical protein
MKVEQYLLVKRMFAGSVFRLKPEESDSVFITRNSLYLDKATGRKRLRPAV